MPSAPAVHTGVRGVVSHEMPWFALPATPHWQTPFAPAASIALHVEWEAALHTASLLHSQAAPASQNGFKRVQPVSSVSTPPASMHACIDV